LLLENSISYTFCFHPFRIQKEDELKEKFGDRVSCIELDVSDAERCKEVVNKIAANHNSKIHTLVNCAAYFGSKGDYYYQMTKTQGSCNL